MSVQVKKELHENLKKGMQMHHAMRVKAEEMIELMQIVRKDAKRRAWQYNLMVRASNAGRTKEVKQLFAEMQTWKKYDIKL